MSTTTLDRAADADFHLVTEWHIAADLDAVWQALNHPDYWPRWWPYVRAVEKLRAGDAEGLGSIYSIEWTSKLPYGFTFEVETVEVIRYERIRGLARGQLNGQGLWEFSPDESSTRVRYTWDVELGHTWMRRLKPLAAPIFRWNHNAVMRAGAVGLARHLHTSLVSST
ncbi:MAG TPA: SRPBCC family protein [Steroidobacteraceae bacterium]|nr:SRPBCC family protein [Steroidobacteraceae bacterium]